MGWLIELIPLSYTSAVVLIGSAILGATAGTLGTFAVLRERSLVGDALAHAALPGVAIAFIATGAKDAGTLLVGAAVVGGIGALLMVGIERAGRLSADTAIGVVLASFFSLGVVLLTFIASQNNANQAGLENYLFGQAAGLLEGDLVVMGLLGAAALGLVAVGYRPLKLTLFDHAFAASVGLPVRMIEIGMTALLVIAIVVGVRTVGAILMVALLIVPTVTARQFTDRLWAVLVGAGAVGAFVGSVGALASTAWGVPTGPVIVLIGFACAIGAITLAPGRGVLWRARRLARQRRKRLVEGVLLDLETAIHVGPPPTAHQLALASGRPLRKLKRALGDLDRAGMLEHQAEPEGEGLFLTPSGAAAVHSLIERRNLWSAWLEHGSELEIPDAREPDPTDLRGSLGDEVADRLDRLVAREGGR